MSTRDLINAIADGEATQVEASFNDIMAAKVSEKLDAMRTDMAQTMFQTPGEPEDESEFEAEAETTAEDETEEQVAELETTTEDNE